MNQAQFEPNDIPGNAGKPSPDEKLMPSAAVEDVGLLSARLGIVVPTGSDLLFRKGEFNKMAPYSSPPDIRSFAIDEGAVKQLRQMSVAIDDFVKRTAREHQSHDRDAHVPGAKFKYSKLIYELHFHGGMTCIVSYRVGQPSPIGAVLHALVEGHQSAQWVSGLYRDHIACNAACIPVVGPTMPFCGFHIHDKYKPYPVIEINQVADYILVFLPHYAHWESSGLSWLWRYDPCCEDNANNLQPWLGSSCSCKRKS